MNQAQAKQRAKAMLEDYLSNRGINTKKSFHCLNPQHPDKNPSMSYDKKRQKAHCFSCGVTYDIFDVISLEYGLTEPKEIFTKAWEVLGIDANSFQKKHTVLAANNQPSSNQHTHTSIQLPASSQQKELQPLVKEREDDFSSYYATCHARLKETDYPQARSIPYSLLRRFQIGYDPFFSKGTGGTPWQALIIPTGPTSYVARNTSLQADKKNRYRKQGSSLMFHKEVLWEQHKFVFVVEGEIDALSVCAVGAEAVALGSTANVQAFLALVQARKPAATLLLALDNAPDGQRATQALQEGLATLRIPHHVVTPYGECKDANEALVKHPEAFAQAINQAQQVEDELLALQREAYLRTSAVNHIKSFVNGISASVDTPAISTGFFTLDYALDGGLYEGLYIVGAISSLGKTTLLTQMADQMAQHGQDVLIFSLEMARSEIMAKSISRHTLLECLARGLEVRHAKTGRGITSGQRYQEYSPVERDLIQQALRAYKEYAGRLYISEGIGNIGPEAIRETVRQHIAFTGRRPVVLIDYLQILAPSSDRMTDKQNTDKAVLELKRVSRDFKIPVIGISSFNRVSYREAVTMEAFKESGAIEYSSDVLIGLQLKGAGGRDFNATEEKRKNPRQIELVILKNRNGSIGDPIPLEYFPLFNYFREG